MRRSETPREALERELREELGIEAKIGRIAASVQHRYAEMREPVRILFLRARFAGEPRNLAFDEMVWARRSELPRHDFLAADRRVIRDLVLGNL